jgi:NSS family neurotransmitter:Na+ symporter
LEPGSGPGLIFETLPRVFSEIPAGGFFGTVFFISLAGAAFLSGVAAFEVLIAGLTDNTPLSRKRATWTMGGIVFLLSLPPMVNMRIFVPWDLTFGSGAQTAGVLVAVLAVGWGMKRAAFLKEVGAQAEDGGPERWQVGLYYWIRWVIPGAILAVGVWWFMTEVMGVVAP